MQPVVQPVIQTGLITAGTTGCIVYTNIQPVEQPVVQPERGLTTVVEQRAASCKQIFNRLSNRFTNRLYRVNGVLGDPWRCG